MVIFDLLSSSWSHLYSFSPLCVLWCRTRSSFWAKLLSHSSVLILKWLFLNLCFLKRCKFTIKNKSFITMATFKWLLPTVHSLMACKFTFNNESFITRSHLNGIYHLPFLKTKQFRKWKLGLLEYDIFCQSCLSAVSLYWILI